LKVEMAKLSSTSSKSRLRVDESDDQAEEEREKELSCTNRWRPYHGSFVDSLGLAKHLRESAIPNSSEPGAGTMSDHFFYLM